MDTGLVIRPTATATQPSIVRPEPAPVREAVATDLAPAQSVTAAAGTNASRHDSTPAPDAQVRKIVLDAHSREVIYQVLDAGSGRVVRQVPDEAMLRLRAYTRAVAEGASPDRGEPGRPRGLILLFDNAATAATPGGRMRITTDENPPTDFSRHRNPIPACIH